MIESPRETTMNRDFEALPRIRNPGVGLTRVVRHQGLLSKDPAEPQTEGAPLDKGGVDHGKKAKRKQIIDRKLHMTKGGPAWRKQKTHRDEVRDNPNPKS